LWSCNVPIPEFSFSSRFVFLEYSFKKYSEVMKNIVQLLIRVNSKKSEKQFQYQLSTEKREQLIM
jgi:hypothetical protein